MQDSNSDYSSTPVSDFKEDEDVYVFPTSFAQQRLWFIDQLEGESSAYNRPAALRFKGALDVSALEQSFNEIIRRHEILRTTFALVDDQPVQLIAPELRLSLKTTDLSALPPAEREATAGRLTKEEAQRPFDLARGPLLRVELLRLAEDEHVLLLTMHHIISDGWSDALMRSELATLYEAFINGAASPLPELPIQYADYALWQREMMQGELLEAGLDYWRKQLAGAPTTLRLQTDRERPATQSLKGATRWFMLDAEVSESLRALSREEGVTLYMTLLAAFQTLLHRYTGQDDIVVGSSISGRTRPEIEVLIGCFVNMLAMRTDMSGNPTFRELLARVREVALGAFVYQDVPFEKLVDELQLRRDMSRAPLFQVLLVLQNTPTDDSKLTGLSFSPMEHDDRTAKLDLSLELRDNGSIISGTVEYSTALFDEASVERIVEHYRILIEGIAANPERRLSELPLLTGAERRQLITPASETRALYPRDASIQELFEAQVERSPEAVAVLFQDEQVTYGELNRRANQCAHYLRSLGVGPEVLVGICMERSVEMLVGLLGILKAGGAYVPLDPEYPQERLTFMLEDAAVPVLVAHERLAAELPIQWAQVVCLDSEWDLIASQSVENPPHEVSAGNLAYVMYTSGSTGQPKGVAVQHRGVVRLVVSSNYAELSPDEVLLQFAPISFDASTFEIWGALLNGGSLVVMPPERPSLEELGQAIARHRVTTLWLAAVVFQQMVEGQLESLRGVRQLLAGGDVLPLAQVDRALRELEQTKLINGYGPTENTTFTCCYVMQGARAGVGSVPVGRAIAGTQAYVLDTEFEPVGVGVAGELCAGGDGLARDYLRRPDLTAERFIPNPFSERGGERLYRTGDLVRFMPDGNIEFLGRLDAQVKVRGYRIELGEVEAALMAHPEVSDVVVATSADEAGEDKRLVAYIVAAGVETLTASELRNFVKGRLPDYMIPSAFVMLEEMPLTPNGKLDRRALPAPGDERPALEKEFAAPATPLQEMLAELWSKVLGIERVGIDDDFFELGGDSIRAAIFINKLQEKLGEIVQVVLIFNAPTIAALARQLEVRYARAVAKLLGIEPTDESAQSMPGQRIDESVVANVRKSIPGLPPRPEGDSGVKNPPAIFILSAPRCGSTLLRVMMAGNPRLFAPPELDLLDYNTLSERKEASSGRDTSWSEGTIRALMELKGCDADEAKEIMADCERQNMTTQQFYRLMQDLIGDRLLVDKTPTYALKPDILKRMETDFDGALYIHLMRHPYGMIRSFDEARVEQLLLDHEVSLPAVQVAELAWLISNQNIREFFKDVPQNRQHEVRFEDLVSSPREMMEKLCAFLGIGFDPGMLKPYEDRKGRMTDGVHAESRMIGDAKFHQHKSIDAHSAERWRGHFAHDFLGDVTWQLATALGYERSQTNGDAQSSSGELTALKPVPRDDGTTLPLSFAQVRLWFIDQMEPGNTFYNLPVAIRLKGRLDVAALERTLNEVIRRHEVLRTTFPTIDGKPAQVIAPSLALNMAVVDLSALPHAQREAETRRLVGEEADAPFDLSRGPLIRAGLLRLSEDEHVVLFTMHHIISDGWSRGVLAEEIAKLYAAFIAGRPSPLPELPVQYADFAVWQRQWLQGETLDAQLQYWRRQLSGAPGLIELPIDHPRPPIQTFRGAQDSLVISSQTREGLRRLCQEEGTTLFMVMLAAFKSLLFRYSRQDDIVVGSPIAGRTRAEIEPLIGFFVNTLVLRTKMSGELSFREALRRVREVCTGAYMHQDMPFEKLVEELQPERDLSCNPLFQVAFHFLNTPLEPLELPGLKLVPMELDHNSAKFDITLTMEEKKNGLSGTMEYNTDLFERETILRIFDHFQRLLHGIVSDPDLPLSLLPLLSDAERRQLIHLWNDTHLPLPPTSSIHRL
ncbi:MAG: amino acid adenylation domain-containing protein, partial [Pyrinomonadaceae bacterium]